MDIQFINAEEWGIEKRVFEPVVSQLRRHLPKAKGELNVIFVDDAKIHRLNKAYRHMDKPTDVLSFSFIGQEDPNHDSTLGEIYISVPAAKKQAPHYGNTMEDELRKLFVHGVLHVFGYDHEREADYQKMTDMEQEILGK